jgi:hypothetical protein
VSDDILEEILFVSSKYRELYYYTHVGRQDMEISYLSLNSYILVSVLK